MSLERMRCVPMSTSTLTEAGDHLNGHGELREPLLEGLEVLEGEDRGRREDRDLLAVLYRLEGRAHGYFGFAVSDVAAEQAIHRGGRLHVLLHGGNRGDLVIRLPVVK